MVMGPIDIVGKSASSGSEGRSERSAFQGLRGQTAVLEAAWRTC